jgi:hypothetical protein
MTFTGCLTHTQSHTVCIEFNFTALQLTEHMKLSASYCSTVQAITSHKVTPLHLTAFFGCPKTLALLLRRGAQSEACDFGAWHALHYACNHGQTECALQLLDAGVNTGAKSAELQFAPIHLGKFLLH